MCVEYDYDFNFSASSVSCRREKNPPARRITRDVPNGLAMRQFSRSKVH